MQKAAESLALFFFFFALHANLILRTTLLMYQLYTYEYIALLKAILTPQEQNNLDRYSLYFKALNISSRLSGVGRASGGIKAK